MMMYTNFNFYYSYTQNRTKYTNTKKQQNQFIQLSKMYRGTPYLNRQIKRREQQRSMQYHISNLTQIRPRTGTIEYGNDVHINNRKGQMQKQARFTQIQRQNRILLEKISSIMGKTSRKASSQQKINRSLNSQLRKRQLQNIQVQNAKLLKRLQQRKPNYETQKFKQSWRKQKYVIKNMSNYPFIINDGRRKRSSVSHIANKDTNPNTIELCRMRTIDGVSFLITIRLNQQRMQIIGDTKDKREIKVIQIERGQAIQFIEEECQGKIQKIFDCLRYDKAEEVLYLVANQVQIEDVKNQATMRIKKNTKRDDNPQFDFSSDIPIHVNNEEKNKFWVEVEKKESQRREKQEQEESLQKPVQKSREIKKGSQTNKKTEEIKKQVAKKQKSQSEHQQVMQKSREIKKQQSKRLEEASPKSNKIESSVNTYAKIKKMTEQSDKQKVESEKTLQKQVSPEIKIKDQMKKKIQKPQIKSQKTQIKSQKPEQKITDKKAAENLEEQIKPSLQIKQKEVQQNKEVIEQKKVASKQLQQEIQNQNDNYEEEQQNQELEQGVQQGYEQQYQEQGVEQSHQPLENVQEMLVDHFIKDEQVIEEK